MRNAFNLVRGAVSEKDLIPVLTHFAYDQGRIHGFNGRVHISVPLDLGSLPSFTVPANLLIAALDACGEAEPQITVSTATVTVAAGTFSADLPRGDIAQFPIPVVPPAPPKVKRNRALLPVLEILHPFIGEDASRPWCAAIKLEAAVAYATNNVVVAAMPLPKNLALRTTCALPVYAVQELLRMGLEPESVVAEGDTALVFYLPGGVYLRSNLIADGWPDVGELLARIHVPEAQWIKVPKGLAAAAAAVTPFCPDPKLPAIVLDGTQVTTRAGASSASVGGFQGLQGTYHAKALEMVLASATRVAWGCFPRVPWVGESGLKGALVGLKL